MLMIAAAADELLENICIPRKILIGRDSKI